MRCLPTRRALFVALAAGLPLGLTRSLAVALILFVVIAAVMAALLVVDRRLATRISVTVDAPKRVSRLAAFSVRYSLHNPSPRAVTVTLEETLDEQLDPNHTETRSTIAARQTTVIEAPSRRALRRGDLALGGAVVRYASPLGLWCTHVPVPLARLVVLPNVALSAHFDALLRQRRLMDLGIVRAPDRGSGSDIVGLKPYAHGDPFNRIDWKATARRSQLVVRETQTERRQNVLLLVDCGRRMAREAEGMTRLDHAVEAALLLSHVALRNDDRVGLCAFAAELLKVVAPVRRPEQASALADALYALTPILKEPPYAHIAGVVAQRFSRRSLVVLLTDVVEPTALESLLVPVRYLSERHLVLVVVFADQSLKRARTAPIASLESLYEAGAAASLEDEREAGLSALRSAGALTLEADSAEMATALANRYLEIKARQIL